MHKNSRIVGLMLAGVVLLVCGCGRDPGTPAVVRPSISLSLPVSTIVMGDVSVLSIDLTDVDERVYALSLRIGYSPAVVDVADGSAFSSGDILGANVVSLFRVESGVIYLAITRLANNAKTVKTGALGTIAIRGLSAGQCAFTVAAEDVHFVDAAGGAIAAPGLAVTGASVVVH